MVILDVNMRKAVSPYNCRENEGFDTADDVLKYVYNNTCAWCCDVFDDGEPTLQCADCEAHLCPTCFSEGQQPGKHRNYHRYTVIPPTKLSAAVDDEASGWTISQELTLLSALEKYGYGDWEAVSAAVARTPEECRQRYDSRYLSPEGPFSWLHEVSTKGKRICQHTAKRNGDHQSKHNDLDKDLFASLNINAHLHCLDTSLMQQKTRFGKLLTEKPNSDESSLPFAHHSVRCKNSLRNKALKDECGRENTYHQRQQLAKNSPPYPTNATDSWRQRSFGLNRDSVFKTPRNEMYETVRCLNGHVVNSTLSDSSREKTNRMQHIDFEHRNFVGDNSAPEPHKQCYLERSPSVSLESPCCGSSKVPVSSPLLEDESCIMDTFQGETEEWSSIITLTRDSKNTTLLYHHSEVPDILNNTSDEQILEDHYLCGSETNYQSSKQMKNMSSEEFLEASGHRLFAAEILPEYLSQYMHMVHGMGNKRLPVPYGNIHKTPGKKPPLQLKRPPPGSVPGYSAVRSEFDIDYDNHAELTTVCVAHVDWSDDDPDADLERALTLAAVSAYNRRLSKRRDTHKLIRGLGLISSSGGFTLGPGKLAPFARLLAPLPAAYHILLTSLSHSVDLRRRITCLSQLRSEAGLWRISQCGLYRRLARNRDLAVQERRAERQRINLTPGTSSVHSDGAPVAPRSRAIAAPLDVSALPGANHLSPSERQLCSVTRILPQAYLNFRRLLENESRRCGGCLKLAQARQLIKIDVNKTRKLYDFLIQQGVFQQA